MSQDGAPARSQSRQLMLQDQAALSALLRLTALVLRVPTAGIVLFDPEQSSVLSAIGLPDPPNTWPALLLCQSTLQQPGAALMIEDLRAPGVGAGAMAPGCAAYAGVGLVSADGAPIGALCVTDSVPHAWTSADQASLLEIATLVLSTIESQQNEPSPQAELEQRLAATELQLAEARAALASELADRKALSYALVETQKRESLGVLAAGIAHNFNNLLSTIMGNAEMALLDLEPDAPAQASIIPITAAAERAALLTRQLLVYAGHGNFMLQRIDLNSIVADVVDLLRASVARRVTLVAVLAPQLPAISADAAQIRQAIANLVTNAVEAIGEADGSIVVATGSHTLDQASLSTVYRAGDLPPGSYLSLSVSDNGCGMDAATCARIFDPFFTTKFMGRGLGLAAVMGIVRGLRGAVGVTSAPMGGTTIEVILPTFGDRE